MTATARLSILILVAVMFVPTTALVAENSIDVGSRRELFVDHHLIDRLDGARLVLHRPTPREIVLKFNEPWEGLYSGYETVLKDGDTFRFYYRGMPEAKHDMDTEVTCIAESKDGVHWTKPKLGIYEVRGTKESNVVLARNRGCHNLAPFVDCNPRLPARKCGTKRWAEPASRGCSPSSRPTDCIGSSCRRSR